MVTPATWTPGVAGSLVVSLVTSSVCVGLTHASCRAHLSPVCAIVYIERKLRSQIVGATMTQRIISKLVPPGTLLQADVVTGSGLSCACTRHLLITLRRTMK